MHKFKIATIFIMIPVICLSQEKVEGMVMEANDANKHIAFLERMCIGWIHK